MEQKDPQKILESLDSWTPLKASPFFASRVMARWENQQEAAAQRPIWQLWWKPALLLAATLINLLLIFGYQAPAADSQDSGLKSFQQEYIPQQGASTEITIYSL